MVTCGDVIDPRIQIAVDVASALTLIFRSDKQFSEGGMRLIIMEINTATYSVSTRATYTTVYAWILFINL